MPATCSRVTVDVRHLELIASKVHVKPLPPVEHIDSVRKHYHLRKLPPIASHLEENMRVNDVR